MSVREKCVDIARSLTRAQRMVVANCGDVKDRFPCQFCGASAPRECGVSSENRRIASQAINDAGGYDALMGAILWAVKGEADDSGRPI